MVITSGYEDEDGDMVVTDTIYADYDDCVADTVVCDTIWSYVGSSDILDLAKEYQKQGKSFETVFALWQSWVMGEMNAVDTYIQNNRDARKAIEFMMVVDDEPKWTKEQTMAFLDTCGMSNDTEIFIFADLLRYAKVERKSESEALEDVFHVMKPKYKDNPFFTFIEAMIEYNEDGTRESQEQETAQYIKAADEGCALAYSHLGTCFYRGRGVDIDIDKAVEYYQKAYNAGTLERRDAEEYLSLLDKYPEHDVSFSAKENLVKMKVISLSYWLKIQKRLLLGNKMKHILTIVMVLFCMSAMAQKNKTVDSEEITTKVPVTQHNWNKYEWVDTCTTRYAVVHDWNGRCGIYDLKKKENLTELEYRYLYFSRIMDLEDGSQATAFYGYKGHREGVVVVGNDDDVMAKPCSTRMRVIPWIHAEPLTRRLQS